MAMLLDNDFHLYREADSNAELFPSSVGDALNFIYDDTSDSLLVRTTCKHFNGKMVRYWYYSNCSLSLYKYLTFVSVPGA